MPLSKPWTDLGFSVGEGVDIRFCQNNFKTHKIEKQSVRRERMVGTKYSETQTDFLKKIIITFLRFDIVNGGMFCTDNL